MRAVVFRRRVCRVTTPRFGRALRSSTRQCRTVLRLSALMSNCPAWRVTIRLRVFHSTRWRDFFLVCLCLALSAFYELIEWWVALLSEEAADSFLGTQGYVWDTQSDMAWALSGAVLALLLLSRAHDAQMQERGFLPEVRGR